MIVVVKPAARADILHQVDYFSELQRPDLGVKFIDALQSSFEHLAKLPFSGSSRSFDHPDLQGLRCWPVKGYDNFQIYYLPNDRTLTIVRVLHGRRDIRQIFSDPEISDN